MVNFNLNGKKNSTDMIYIVEGLIPISQIKVARAKAPICQRFRQHRISIENSVGEVTSAYI